MTATVIKETINTQPTWSEAPEASAEEVVEATEGLEEALEESVEELVEETQPEPKADPIEAKRFNELVRRDGEQQNQIQQLKNQLREQQELQNLFNSDPLAALAKLNVNTDDIINKALGLEPAPVDPVTLLTKDVQALKEEREALKKAQEQQRQEQAVKAYHSEISDAIQSNVDKYELCSLSADDAITKAYSVIDYEYQQTGQLIDIEQALDVVENHYEKEARRLAAAKKLGYQQVKIEEKQGIQAKAPQAPGTLTNKSQSSAPATVRPFELTVEDSKRRAADLLKWI